MNVIQRPGAIELAADMPDYIIDTDSTITFEVEFNGQKILSEEYVPDAAYQVRIRKIGRFCAKALWGVWPSANTTYQQRLSGTFSFLINGVKDTDTYVLFSRFTSKKTPAAPGVLSTVSEKVTRPDVPEFASFYLTAGQPVMAEYIRSDGQKNSAVMYTHVGERSVCTLDTSYTRIRELFSDAEFNSYAVGGMTFHVDRTAYAEKFVFRFLNAFDVPETVCAVGSMVLKGGDNSQTGFLWGVERRFVVDPADEYTVNSGVIFRQADYRLWHDFLGAQQAQIRIEDTWYDIVITNQNYERDFRKNVLKAVEFSFRFADPDNNRVL